MPGVWIDLVACTVVLLLGPADDRQTVRSVLGDLNPPIAGLSDAALAGLSAESRPEVLTWERIYALALIRARSGPAAGGGRGLAALDPERLDAEAKKLGVADFDRFRRDFFARPRNDGTGFRDPAADVLDLLRRAQAVEVAMKKVAAREHLFRVSLQLIKFEPPPRPQLEIDGIDDEIQQARITLVEERRRLRDGLDALKVELGLAPEAPVVLDRSSLAAFGAVFAEAAKWSADPGPDFTRLSRIAEGLPPLDDVVIEGRSLVADFRQGSDRDDNRLQAVGSLAIRNRRARGGDHPADDPDDALVHRVRREVRALEKTWLSYTIEKRRFVLLHRQLSEAYAQIMVPPFGVKDLRKAPVADATEALDRLLANQDRLVALWTTYQAQCHALCRDLGTLPADDWKTFLGQFAARKGDAAPR